MSPPRLVEMFNTHRMLPEIVRLLATGREEQVHALLHAIRQAAAHPEAPAQHVIVYGERGSGKSFLLRVIELKVEQLVHESHAQLACALLPEEQYDIKTLAQLLEAVAAKVRGADWSATAYAFDARPEAQAWDAAVEALHAALDERFGPGQGLAVAMIENFDVVCRNLFGAETHAHSRKAVTAAALARRAAEERLREFMGRAGARCLLLATATGTVDLDYERPLFLAFKSIDLPAWDGDTCIAYFSKHRQLQGMPELSPGEIARARAIAEFIGGNPRLAQLLAEVLNVPDAHTISQTLDALSDHLADYYRRRLDDLPAHAAGLLDALIRQGEPCSQSQLAERIGVQQSQIADAFRYLVQARLLSAARERHGHGTLYRVRDRLFVHFYRRRYGGAEQSAGLAPIVELLAAFFSAREQALLARRYLEDGAFADAGLFRRLGGMMDGASQGYDGFRDSLLTDVPSKLWDLTGLAPDEAEPARLELRAHAAKACKRWGDAARLAPTPLQRTTAKILQAVAASRLGDDVWAKELLEEARGIADTDATTDARILAVDCMAAFSWYRLRDQQQAVQQAASLHEWVSAAQHEYPKLRAHLDYAWNLGELGRHEAALAASEAAASLAQQAGDVSEQARALRLKGWSLGQLGRHEEAIVASEAAARLAQQAGDVSEQARALRHKGWSLGQLGRHAEALTTFDHAATLAKEAQAPAELAEALRLKSTLLRRHGQLSAALESIQAALAVTARGVRTEEQQWVRRQFLQIAAQIPAPEMLAQLSHIVQESTTDDRWFDSYLNDALAAVTRAEAWGALQTLVREHAAWFAHAAPASIFNAVGTVWADFVAGRGRAATFAIVARDLPSMAEVMQRIPPPSHEKSSAPVHAHLRDLVAGLVAHCADAGFLRDLAPLIVEVFGVAAVEAAQRLSAFAEFHAAADKEQVLQRFDPDLARAIRRMWHLPEPEDVLARRGRPTGR